MKPDFYMEKEEKLPITPEQAKSLLPDCDRIHTFRALRGILIGSDNDKSRIIEIIEQNPERIEIGGNECQSRGHGLVVWTESILPGIDFEPLFIEADREKLRVLENELLKK
jgi:hypothetical protein